MEHEPIYGAMNSESRKRQQERLGTYIEPKTYADMHVDPPSTREQRRAHNLAIRTEFGIYKGQPRSPKNGGTNRG